MPLLPVNAAKGKGGTEDDEDERKPTAEGNAAPDTPGSGLAEAAESDKKVCLSCKFTEFLLGI